MSRKFKTDFTPYLNGKLTVPEIVQLTGRPDNAVREFATKMGLPFKRMRQTEFRKELINVPSKIYYWLETEAENSGVSVERMIRAILTDAYNEENPPPENPKEG